MDIINLYNFYSGYVKIKIKGKHLERFLNLITTNLNLYIWDISRISEEEATLKISLKGFKKIRKHAYKTKTKVEIVEKNGLYKYLQNMKKRKIIVFAGVLFTVFIVFITSLVLDIEVKGNILVEKEEILEKLNDIGLKKGVFRSKIDNREIEVKLMNEIEEISWVGISEEGTRLVIEIKERRIPPKIIPMDVPCKIIAGKDAIIKSITAANGNAVVELNQTVKKGDLLISGIIETKNDGVRTVHSMASVKGRTWYENFSESPLFVYEKQYTGNISKAVSFYFNGKLLNHKDVPYYNYDEKSEKYVIGPLTVIKREFTEYNLIKKGISDAEAEKNAKKELENLLYKSVLKGDVVKISYERIECEKSDYIKLRMLAECEEEIAQQAEITQADLDYATEEWRKKYEQQKAYDAM
ncbi:MAG: sporulation protein YqfD [Clostridia bacterium]|nr:sporulation protein YqfD [Clostridia bacterium]